MIRVIRETNPKANKDHNCEACDWIKDSGIIYEKELTSNELHSITEAKRNNWKIKKGSIYNRQVNICDGDIYTFKSIPEILQICLDHDLFDAC